MSALDELRKGWKAGGCGQPAAGSLDEASLGNIIRTRIKKQHGMVFRYFWATFALHVLAYALLSHVLVRYGADTLTLALCLTGILATVPFTAVMVRRYSRMAAAKARGAGTAPIREYVARQREALSGFLAFKRRYETVLIPLNSAIGVLLTFHLFFPGGVAAYPIWALATYLVTLLGCAAAVRSENRKSFLRPLRDLQAILDEYREEPGPPSGKPGGREA